MRNPELVRACEKMQPEIRSGPTLRELNVYERQSLLMERFGISWDAMPLPFVEVSVLSKEALDAFRRKAVGKKRMTLEQSNVSDEALLDHLHLMQNGKLTRAAVMLFHPKPERFVTGASIKVGYFAPVGDFGENPVDDIIYSDDIQEPIFLQTDKTIDLIYTKYLRASCSYEGLERKETFLWPKEAFREVLLNAIIHKSYESGIPIQIRVYDDKITIWNDGAWPKKLDVGKVYERHPSIPYNPKMANVFYRSGEIESEGRSFEKIRLACDKQGAPYPVIHANPEGGVELECKACEL